MNAETILANQIREALGGTDLPVLVWRLNQGSFRGADGATRFYGLIPGASDLVGLVRGSGRLFACEVKTARGRESEHQRLFRGLVTRTGGYACVARSVPEALDHAHRAASGE